MIDYDTASKLLEYKDGDLYWKKSQGTQFKGRKAGSSDRCGYLRVAINGIAYRHHRIVWLLCNGYLPEFPIDHIDKNKKNNLIENLREVTRVCNARNSKQRKSASGVKGVNWCNGNKKWIAKIFINGRSFIIGMSECKIEAACLRLAAEQCVGWINCDTISPSLLFVKKYAQKCTSALGVTR